MALQQVQRFSEALAYAQAVYSNFQTYSDRAAFEIEKAQRLIKDIQQAMQQPGCPS